MHEDGTSKFTPKARTALGRAASRSRSRQQARKVEVPDKVEENKGVAKGEGNNKEAEKDEGATS